MNNWKNRILGYSEAQPEQLLANPFNHRIHSRIQQKHLQEVLSEVGWVDDVIVNQTTGHIIDGHLRVTLALRNEQPVPVKYVDLSEAEEKLVLASFDWITGEAGVDRAILSEALASIDFDLDIIDDMSFDLGLDLNAIEWGEAFDKLPDGERAPFQQMTFTLHDDQVDQVKRAVAASKKSGPFDSENKNSNGNALARICETYITDYGKS